VSELTTISFYHATEDFLTTPLDDDSNRDDDIVIPDGGEDE
jgi:hypothetical protein